MTTFSVSQTREHLSEILNQVYYKGEKIIVQKHGKQVAAVISINDFELLERILERLEEQIDIEEIDSALLEADEQGTIPWGDIKKELNL